jgi:hypothetical protein
MLYSIASLNEKELDAVQTLEKQIGKRVLAMKPLEIEFDNLAEDDVAAIQMLEVDTGLVIVAVK